MEVRAIEDLYIKILHLKRYNLHINEDIELFRKAITQAKLNLNMKSKNYDSIICSSILDSRQFNLDSYTNINNDFVKASLIAIEESLILLEKGLENTIGISDINIFSRLLQDSGIVLENSFEDLFLREKSTKLRFSYGYYRSYSLLPSISSVKFSLKANEELNSPNSVDINSRVTHLCVDIRKLIELYFLKCLNNENEFIDSKGVPYPYLKGLFKNAVIQNCINYNDAGNNEMLSFIIQSYEFLGSAIHRLHTAPIYTPLYILKRLLDDYFERKTTTPTDLRGFVELKNIKIDKELLNSFLLEKIPDYYEKK